MYVIGQGAELWPYHIHYLRHTCMCMSATTGMSR